MFFIGFYQVPVLIKVSEKCFTNVATRRARHRVGTFFFLRVPLRVFNAISGIVCETKMEIFFGFLKNASLRN
ncbi:hypothetical protein AUF12_04910 [Enterococcus avium]|nr:hypothetical protein AUF12_04910 [Enterococcus avium]